MREARVVPGPLPIPRLNWSMRMSKTDSTQDPREESEVLGSSAVPPRSTIMLDARSREISGLETVPLLSGEFALLAFLGARPFTWHSSRDLSVTVYRRSDEAARQLVWTYISRVRKKLSKVAPRVIEVCRSRGYSCRAQVVVVGADPELDRKLRFNGTPCAPFGGWLGVCQAGDLAGSPGAAGRRL
jgi:hypothetical protein